MLFVQMLSIFNKRIFKRKGPKLCTLAIHCAIVAPQKRTVCLTLWCLCATFFRLHDVTLACAWAPYVTHAYSDPPMTCLYIALLLSHFGPRCIVMDLVEMTLLPRPSTCLFSVLILVIRSTSFLCLVPPSDHKMVFCRLKNFSHLHIFWFLKGELYLVVCWCSLTLADLQANILNMWICFFPDFLHSAQSRKK